MVCPHCTTCAEGPNGQISLEVSAHFGHNILNMSKKSSDASVLVCESTKKHIKFIISVLYLNSIYSK